MAQYCHASHEVYHEGVAQRAHNLSPVPFGAAKATKESSYHCSDTASQILHGRRSLLAVGAERHITCPSAYRAIGASVQKLWRAFGKLGVGSPALLFSFPLGCRW